MPCYSLLHAYEGAFNVETGKVSTVWSKDESPEQVKRDIPCGQCVGCRLEYSRRWAARCLCESQMHAENCFITLTFDEEHLPLNRSLDVVTFQKFIRALRKELKVPIRYFHAGEYGDKFGRPHYHALLFGYDFPDKKLLTIRNENRIYTSDILASVWKGGYSSVGALTFESAAYVARYCMKKVKLSSKSPDKFLEHYVDKRTGECLKPEYTTMSRRPGIGKTWFERFKSDVFPSDEFVVRGLITRPPRYFDNLLDSDDPQLLDLIRSRRKSESKFISDSRLLVMEEVKLAQIKSLKRPLEDC